MGHLRQMEPVKISLTLHRSKACCALKAAQSSNVIKIYNSETCFGFFVVYIDSRTRCEVTPQNSHRVPRLCGDVDWKDAFFPVGVAR